MRGVMANLSEQEWAKLLLRRWTYTADLVHWDIGIEIVTEITLHGQRLDAAVQCLGDASRAFGQRKARILIARGVDLEAALVEMLTWLICYPRQKNKWLNCELASRRPRCLSRAILLLARGGTEAIGPCTSFEDWVEAHVRHWQKLLDLVGWDIRIRYGQRTDGALAGEMWIVDPHRRLAELWIDVSYLESDRPYETVLGIIIHELLELLFRPWRGVHPADPLRHVQVMQFTRIFCRLAGVPWPVVTCGW